MSLGDKLQQFRSRWERLSNRERRLLAAGAATLLGIALAAMGGAVAANLNELEEANAEMRQALKDIAEHHDAYQQARAKNAQLEVRMGSSPVQLQGYLESAAKETGVEIAESDELPPQPVGKKYLERAVNLRLRRVGLDALTKYLRRIETGPNLVIVSALGIRVVDDKREQFEVEMKVSAFEHNTEPSGIRKGKEG